MSASSAPSLHPGPAVLSMSEPLHPDAESPPRSADAELLDRGVREGIISQSQRDRLLSLSSTLASSSAVASSVQAAERRPGFNAVTVAYGLGAMLVLFACGWFLVDRWAQLGPWGVLAVVAAYAAVMVAASRWLLAHRFQLAADIMTMLATCLSPLVSWSFLSLAGRWPVAPRNDPLLQHSPWMAYQWLVLDLTLILVALLVLRRRRIVTLTWPLTIALWATWLHVGQLLHGERGTMTFDSWIMLANGLLLLFVAERVERWQRREGAGRVAADGFYAPRDVLGDFANAFWVSGLLATGVAYMAIWLRADGEASQHLLPVFALGLVALSLYLRRRVALLFGVGGILGYLAFLAQDVFKDYVSFPILLAGFGILLILATVWTQTRFPALVERIDARRGDDERPLPWSPFTALLPTLIAIAMAVMAWFDAGDEREQRAFRERLHLLRMHSGSLNRELRAKGRAPRPEPAALPSVLPPAGNLRRDSS